MIKTDRQLKIAQEKLDAVEDSIKAASGIENSILRGIEEDSLRGFAEDLSLEIAEYTAIRRGDQASFQVTSLDGIADALVKARIAIGWTQAQLAERLHVAEQQVQRDEAGGYERAKLSRLADIADVLGYQLTGVLEVAKPEAPLTRADLDQSVPVASTGS